MKQQQRKRPPVRQGHLPAARLSSLETRQSKIEQRQDTSDLFNLLCHVLNDLHLLQERQHEVQQTMDVWSKRLARLETWQAEQETTSQAAS